MKYILKNLNNKVVKMTCKDKSFKKGILIHHRDNIFIVVDIYGNKNYIDSDFVSHVRQITDNRIYAKSSNYFNKKVISQ